MLILAGEWSESLQQHEGKNKITAVIEDQKKYFHLQVFCFIETLIQLSKV